MTWQGTECFRCTIDSIHINEISDFIDKGLLEGGFLREAAILGLEHDPNDEEGAHVWAQSAGCNVWQAPLFIFPFFAETNLCRNWDALQISGAEHATIVDGLRDPPLREISIGGRKYRCTMSTLDIILGTSRTMEPVRGPSGGGGNGRGGCIIRKTNMAVIVAEYGPARSEHAEVLRGVDEFAEYLIQMGY